MRSLLTRSRDESGQAFVFVALILTVLVGMAALVVDGGSWYRAQRHLQTAADAAALAGAQELPRTAAAAGAAIDYGTVRNGSGLDQLDVDPTFPEPYIIDVSATAKTPGIFARIYESVLDPDGKVSLSAHAQAQVMAPLELNKVAPIAVHTGIACGVTNPSCFGKKVELNFDEDNRFDPTKSKFGLLDLDRDGKTGASDLKNWISQGYPGHLPVDTYYPPANGEKNGIKKELGEAAKEIGDADAEVDRALLFPVYDTASASTGYHVIGWAAFVIDKVVKWNGHDHELEGHFVTYIATGLAAGGTITDPDNDFGVHVITLTK